MDLFAVFIDLKKAFDMVNREELLSVLLKLDYPQKFTRAIRLSHDKRLDRSSQAEKTKTPSPTLTEEKMAVYSHPFCSTFSFHKF